MSRSTARRTAIPREPQPTFDSVVVIPDVPPSTLPPDHCTASAGHVEWTGVVPIGGPPLLRDDRGDEGPSADRMLWMFTGQRVRIRIDSLGPIETPEESKK